METSNKVNLKIITPEGIFWDKPVEIVTLRTTEGAIGLQKGRSPFVASLAIAELTINMSTSPEARTCAIAGGLVIANANTVSIITSGIEFKENIDISRAERAKRLAEEAIKASKDEVELFKAQLALKKAINRIEVHTA